MARPAFWSGPRCIAPDRLTIAGLARQQGYRTACIGKWHLGWDWPMAEGQRRFFTGFGGVLHPRYLAQRQTMAHRIWRHAGAIPGRLAQGVSRQR